MNISIRKFAQLIGVSHTAVRNMIEAYKEETGIELGKKQGAGKAVLLSVADQQVLRERVRDRSPAKLETSAIAQHTYMPQPMGGAVKLPTVEIFNVDTGALETNTSGNFTVLQDCRTLLERLVTADGFNQGKRLAALHRDSLFAGLATGQAQTVEMYQAAHAEQSKSQ